jgi:hypothetical protein
MSKEVHYHDDTGSSTAMVALMVAVVVIVLAIVAFAWHPWSAPASDD